MNHNQDLLIDALQDATGSTSRNILDLWRIWLVAEGYTTGTVMDRLDRVARERGYTAMRLLQGHPTAVAAVLNSGPPTPAAPTIGTATRTASQTVSVTFTPSPTDGSLGVTGYTVTSIPGSLTGTGASSPISVAGLTNGTEYRFTVHATNVSGNSPESEQSNIAVPATVPGAPTAVVATAGDANASIAFTAPASNGGSVITGYTVTTSPGGIVASGTSSPISVTGLTNNTDYTVTVKATNQYGDSAASSVSNVFTPIITPTGPFNNLYAPSWAPESGTTVFTKPVQSAPAKSTGITAPSYTDASYATKVFRVAQLSDSPGQTGTTKMRHEYSRRCPWNADSTKFILQNSHGFHFVYDADTFTRLDGGVTTLDQKRFAVGTNSIYPKDPRDWTWHPTDPNKIIFKSVADDLNFYEFDVVTKALTTKFTFAGRLGAWGMGAGTNVTTGGEGRPSDNARYWGFMVKDAGGANLGYITYDMQTDTILGAMLTSRSSNNVTMSSNGNYVIMSGPQGSSYATAAAASELTGVRAYTRDFSSFKQLHYWGTHADIGIDYLGREVYITLNQGGSNWTAVPTNSIFMITCAGAEGPIMLVDTGDNSSQWNSHYSGTNTPGRPGWFVLSMWDEEDRGTREWLDDSVSMVELKPSPQILRIFEHRTRRFTYWQEPHSAASRDGLRIMSSVSWDSTSSTDPGIAYMVGLPTWIYGDAPPTNLLGNGTFTDSTGWSLGTSCTVTGGKLHCNNTAANVTNGYATTALPPGTYEVTFTLSDFNAGNVTMRIAAGTTVSGATRSAGVTPAGTYTDTITIANTSTAFEIRVTRQGATMDVKVDDISIVAV